MLCVFILVRRAQVAFGGEYLTVDKDKYNCASVALCIDNINPEVDWKHLRVRAQYGEQSSLRLARTRMLR